VLSSNSVTIGCKRLEDSGRGMNGSSRDHSNVKLFGFDAYVFINILSKT
jgi:hypothetical protein